MVGCVREKKKKKKKECGDRGIGRRRPQILGDDGVV
jgi:hypothetical protein